MDISSETGLQRESTGVVANSIVIDGESWRCLDLAVIPDCAWYRIPKWNKLETEPRIFSSIIDLSQAGDGWRCNDGLSTPMYEKMRIIRNRV